MNRHTRIKICGITRSGDGRVALEAGADLLGFIRWPGSKRFRPIGECAGLIAELRDAGMDFQAVGVFVNAPAEEIAAEQEAARFDLIQLHGAETPEFATDLARVLAVPVIKSLGVRGADSLRAADSFPPDVTLLTDAFDPDQHGGTGKSYDYSLLKDLAAARRVFVAGGLTAENVAGVIREVRPYGVDVSSGVEVSPGIKDPERVAEFIRRARGVEAS